jgi:hypothetical protein
MEKATGDKKSEPDNHQKAISFELLSLRRHRVTAMHG